MKRQIKNDGFTLLEVAISVVLASFILAAIIGLLNPFLNQFIQARKFQNLRTNVVNPMDVIRRDIENALVTHSDSTKCYKLCMIDRTSGQRIFYYQSGTTLYRKQETMTSAALSCSGGKVLVQNLDTTNSSFSRYKEMITTKLRINDTNNTAFILQGSFAPIYNETEILFYDGFGCASIQNWTLATNGAINWAIVNSSSANGTYWLQETLSTNQATALTATATANINLGQATSAILQFKYRTSGTMDPGENLTVSFYDGSWHQIFIDDLGGSISALSTVNIDLSGYQFTEANQLQFEGSLSSKNDKWIIDEIKIITK